MEDLILGLLVAAFMIFAAICGGVTLGFLIYGLYTSFKVSLLIGLFFLLVEPLAFLQGVMIYFYGFDLAQAIQAQMHLPF